MTSSLSKNLSHRHLFNQKTNQLYYYHQCVGKSNKIVSSPVVDATHRIKNDPDHETSINLDRSDESSLSKRQRQEKESASREKLSQAQSSTPLVRNLLNVRKRPNLRNYKSLEAISKKKSSIYNIQRSFSIKKLPKNQVTASNSQPKLASIECLQLPQSSKKHETMQPIIFKSQTDLKLTLKKTSTSKLRLKVKDPFEKRVKLDIQFKDQSVIEKMQSSMMSTLNQQEFREILSKMQ